MKVRLFGSSSCKNCLELDVTLNKAQVDYEYIDAFDENEDIQKFCDEHNVEALPHIQFIEGDEIVVEHKGCLTEDQFVQYLADYFPTY